MGWSWAALPGIMAALEVGAFTVGAPPAIIEHVPLSPALRAALVAALAEPAVRIRRVEAHGETVWLKRVERLSWRWRLQKGDGRRAFAAERAGLRDLAARGLPVVPVLAEGDGFLVMPAAGRSLAELLMVNAAPADRVTAFAAGGAALARLHAAGAVHGRPAVRDILWDGQAARFIDFERYRPGRAGAGRQARDLVIALHSIFAIVPQPGAEIGAFHANWLAGVSPDAPAAVARLVRRLRWLGVAARLMARWRPRSRELMAVPLVLDWLAGHDKARGQGPGV